MTFNRREWAEERDRDQARFYGQNDKRASEAYDRKKADRYAEYGPANGLDGMSVEELAERDSLQDDLVDEQSETPPKAA